MSALFTGVKPLRACRTRIHVFSARAGRVGGLLLAALLASLPLPAVAQTQGVSISVSPEAVGRYSSINEGQTATFTVSRTGDNSDALTVNFTASPGGGPAGRHYENAVEGSDYTTIPESHTFLADDSAPHDFTVTINDDDPYEPNEYFTLTASGSYQDDQDMTVEFSDKAIVRIKENDKRYLTLKPVSGSALGSNHPEFMAKEGGINDDDKNELTITLNAPLPYVLQIPYTVGFSPHTTAATSDDFTMRGGTANIPAGDMFVTIDVGIVDDDRVEPTEYFTLQLRDPKYDTMNNAIGTYNGIGFTDSELPSQPLSVSIMDNDTQSTGGVVYLRGEGPSGPGVIDKYPSTRRTLTEGQSTIITAEIAGAAPSSAIEIPLKFDHYPNGEATEDDYSIPTSITIPAGQNSAGVTLTITNDTDDERYRELLVVEIDEMDTNFPADYTKGDRSRYEVIMLDNDKTGAKLQGLSPSTGALSEASGKRQATFQIEMDRLPKKDTPAGAPFSGVTVAEGDPTFKLEYSGAAKKATRNDDYMSPIDVQGNNCSTTGGKLTCTVTFTAKDDKLYEGGSGTTEKVAIRLRGADWKDSDGIENTGPNLSLTIEDNDKQPMLSIGDVTANEGGKLAFEVTRAGAMENKLSVRAATAVDDQDGANHAANSDYETRARTLEFAKGNMKQTFEVTTTQDVIDEMDETFLVKLSNAKDTGGEPKPGIEDDTAIGTIKDNDDAPTELTITVDTDTGTDGNQDTIAEAATTTTVSVTATIDSPTRFATDQDVIITVGNSSNEDEASEGADGDYETVDQFTITISATEASGKGTFELKPLNDRIDDDGEKISVEGELGDMMVTHAAITIEDDDTRGITVSKTTLTIDEADDTSTEAKENEGTYEVVLKSEPTGTVTVDITNPGPTVATVDPSSLTFTAANWETAQTVTVIAKDHTIDDTGNQKTTTITHTVSANGTDYAGEEVDDVEITVLDDDEAPMALTITLDTDTDTADNQSTISEGDDKPTVRITATLDGETQFATDQTITITVGDSDKDTATEGDGGDYNTVHNFDITLPAEEASVYHDLSLSLINDTVDEPDETVTVAGKLAELMVTDTMFTIEDNDATPTVTLVLTPASINESGATNASTVTATMNGESSEAVTLTVSSTPVSPAVAGDLTLSDNKTLTIPANTLTSTGAVTIAAVDNDVDAADKTVTVSATATGGNALVQPPGSQTLTITDDDTRGITVSKATLTLDEVDNTGTMNAVEHQDTYTVVLDSEPSGGAVTVGIVSAGTNIATVAPKTLTFTATNWDEPQTVTVTAVPDGIDNMNDRRAVAITHTVTATGTDYHGASASGVTVTVNDDDGPPTLSINSPSVTEVDSGATSTLTFTVQLLPQSGNTVTVAYADTGAGTALSGGDYEALAGGTLTFIPSETSKSVAVTVNGDDIDELDETVVVRLSSPSKATLTGGATTLDGTGTINDNDSTPTVSIADAAGVSEGNVASPDSPNNMTFVVTLSAVSGLEVTVPYTLSGTATAGTDYTEPDPRSVTIAAGTTQANIEISVAGDEVDEENETITVTLGTPTNATVSTDEGAGAASGTITDDDTRGVSVTPTALTVAEADNAGTAATRENQESYKVVLTSQPTGAVTINLKSGDESVARINTASLVFDADDWNSERTVIVTGQADVIDNMDNMRKVDISHTVSAEGTDYEDETAKSVAVTVTDDDAAPSGITLTANPDSVTENGGAKNITVTAAVNGATRYAEARTVSVSVGGGTAISGTDYTAVESFDITIGAGENDASNTFTLTPENDVLAEGSETIDVTGTLSGITITPDEITLTDDDAAPSGITLSVDTNGAEDGTPDTVAEDAGATVVTVTATVNGTTRYVDAKTVAVSVVDNTAASPADYAAVNNFNITIAAGAASHTGTFTVTPVDDDLDESDETIDVTGTLSSVTITGATVTLTDNDDPVSFSIADAEATEGGKVTFTVNRAGAEDNVASVKVTTATDSGDGVNAADADDYTAIATAQTLNFAKGVTSQTVEVQTTQDDLFELDETFNAVLSEPALGDGDPGTGVTIESGKGTAIGTIKNDDTKPSFAVADASASEGDGITFTVTRSGAMDNAVSVKWNTKADSSDGANAASASDYTPVAAATTLTFAKGVGSQTFTVATTEDNLDEDDETFLVELTEAVGGTIDTAQATGTINDDDDAPSGITLSVDTNGTEDGAQSTVAEGDGATVVTVTATVNGTTRYVDAKTVAVSVVDNTAASPADYAAVSNFNITIAAGAASHTGTFTVTPVDDDLDESDETIDVTGTLSSVTITGATVTLTDNDDPVSFSIADAEATEGGKVTFTVSRKGAGDNVAAVKIATAADSGDGVNAASTSDYTAITTAQTLNFAKGVATQTVEVQTAQDDLFEPDETFKAVLSEPALGDGDPGTGVSIESGKGTAIGTIKNDDTEPSFAVADASASEGDAITFTVTRSGAMDNVVSVKWNTKAATGANAASATDDYTPVTAARTLSFAKGVSAQTFTVATTEDVLHEGNETFLVELTAAEGATITTAQAIGTINDDDAAPTGITLSVDTNGSTAGTPSTVAEDAGATMVTVTATVNGTTRYVDAKTVVVSVADNTAASPADYAAVSGFNITIAAGAASQTGSFTVTPVDDDLDESNETIDVTGTLSSVTITGATVTLTDNDDPVSFSIADAEATEGGKVTFTVSRKGAGDNVAAVKIATAADSGDDVNAADADDYTAIATAQTLNFAKGVTTQTVEVQTAQDDLFELDETFNAVLSEPALGDGDPGTGVTIESGKGTAIGTIKNDDTKPSFAVADASASEGDGITFTVTRSGAMDNAVSVKWNTKADSSDGANAASASDYTPVAAATTLTFAKGVGSQTFTVATTEDNLDEDDETFLVELTEAVGGTIDTAQATGTINDDDDAPSGITLSVDTNGTEDGAQSTVAEDAGATMVTVTATVNGTTRYVDAKTVVVSVADNTAASPADYAAVSGFNITIAAGAASQTGSFTVTPVDDDLDESNETIDVTGTLTDITITAATVTLTDTDDPVSFSIADAEATEGGKVTFTVSREGAGDNVASVKIATAADSGDDVNAADADDYTAIATAQTLNFAAGDATQTVEVQTAQDDLFEPDETFKAVLSAPALGENDPGTGVSIESGKGTAIGTIKNDDFQPSFAVADASASEGDAITFTVTRSGAMDNAVSVKWNTKADSSDGANAASATDDYTPVTAARTLSFAKGVSAQTFTVATTEDVLHEGNETFLVELTAAEGATITTAQAIGTINDDDAAPTGITLSVDTNGSTAGTPSTVAEDAGATMVTVTATVNGTTRYVDAKTVVVSVADNTAASPADYAAVSGFNITIAAGAASQTGSFTVTPVDDDLDESNETIDVTGTLTDITITAATVTLTDTDDPVSFSIADAEATEGGKVTFTVSREGAGDNVASVKIATAADSGDDVNAASTSDYTAIATAQTLNFAAGDATQMVEVQTTQDDLFEPDETFKAVLSEPALGDGDPGTGVSIVDGKGTATGTIKNDDTQPSFAVANASASEGDAITFTVTRSGAMDNAVSVKWNTKAATGAGAASTTDYTEMTTATKLDFTKGVGTQTFTVATTEDVLHEGNETFLVELTGAVGGTIATAEATGTINDDDAAPTGITLSVSPTTVGEEAGETEITVTATVNGTTRYVDAKTVTVSVGGGTAISGTDYDAVSNFDIIIAAGDASKTGTFDLTPTQDELHEGSETINLDGTLTGVTVTDAMITLTDDDGQPSFAVADASANEGDAITFTVTRSGAMDNAVSVKWNTKAATGAGAAVTTDYTAMTTATKLDFAMGVGSQTFTVATTEDTMHEGNETFLVELTEPVGATITDAEATGTITDDDALPTALTLSVDADTDTDTNNVQTSLAEDGGAKMVRVTASLGGSSTFNVAKTVAVEVGADADGATEGTDYTNVGTQNITINAGASSGYVEFTLTPTDDDIDEPDEGISIEGTLASVTVTGTSLTITDDEATPTVTLVLTPATINESGETNASTVTATLSGESSAPVTVTVSVPNDAPVTLSTNTTLTIAAGSKASTGAVTITAVDNDVDAPNASVVVSGVASGGGVAVANPDNQTLTVTDDEATPTVTLVLTPATINESGETNASTVTATLSGESSAPVTVTVSVPNDAPVTLSTNTTLTIAAGSKASTGAVTITAVDNDVDAPNASVVVSGVASGGGVAVANPDNQTLTVTDDEDTPTVTLVLTPSTINENGNGNASTVTAMLSGKSNEDVTLTVAAAAGADTTASDFALSTTTTLTIAAGATTSTGAVTITAVDNDIDAPNKTVTVSATASGGDVANPTNLTLTINDDEGLPTATLVLTPTMINESGNGNASTVTATLSGKSNTAVTLTVAAAAGADTDAGDFTVSANKTLSIAAGATTSTGAVTITAVDNNVDAPNKTVTVSATASGGGVTDPTNQTLTITDDDEAPSGITLSVSPTAVGEEDGITEITVTATVNGATRYVDAKTVTVSVGGGTAISGTDYDAVSNFDIIIAAGDASKTGTFDLTPTQDDLHEGNETINVSGTSGSLTITQATITINDDDAAPSGITLSVDTNGSTAGTPSTVAENAGATVVTVTATVNGTTRYVEAQTVAVSVVDNTAASPADYAAVSNFNITIAAGAASHTGSFTVTPVDDDLDESNETIDVTGTLTDITITGATVTLTDNDDPVSFSIADAEATEGGKVVFTVSRAGAEDNVVSVKIATAADSGDGVNAASTSDYTAIATAQTLNFAKRVTSQTVEVQTTQDDLFEPDETFKAVLSEPALADGDPGTGVSIESGKGTAIGTIKNDDTEPSFAVADANASEGDGITFTVTRSGAMDNAVSVKWNTKADTGDGAALASDYTRVTTARTLSFAKGVSRQTFTVATTEDVLAEGNETFLVELTGAVGGTITTAQATGTINDDDAAPSGITLTVSPATVGEGAGETEITVTATVNGTTRYVDAKTVTVSVGGGTAISDTDYDAVANFDITIAAGDASKTGTFDLTPTQDDLHEGSETINVSGTSDSLTITPATVTINDDDGQPSFAVADASANEGDTITFTVTRSGAMDNAVSVKWNTKADSSDGANAALTSDYTAMTTATKLDFAKGVGTQTFTVATTEDSLHEGDETFLVELTEPVGAIISDAEATGTITDDDVMPSTLTLSVDADTGTNNVQTSLAEDGGEKTVRVTATLGGSSTFTEAKTVAVEVGADADGATEGTDYTNVGTQNITINAGASSGYVEFTLTPTNDDIDEPDEGISIEGTLASVTVTGTSLTITDDEGTPTVTLVLTPSTINESGDTNSSTVTATLSGKSSVAVTLTVAAAAGADTASGDFTVTANKTLTIAEGATTSTGAVTITAVDNDVDAPNKTVTVSATASGGGVANPGNQTLTITDDEGIPTATLVLTPTMIDESGATNASTVTATLSGKSNTAVTLTVAAAAGADTASGDFTVTANKTLTIAAGTTTSTGAVTITAVDNDVDAPNKTVTVSATASGGGVANPGNQTLTITDDEGTPTVTLVLTPSTINESGNGNASTVTATLSGESSAAVTVEVSVPNNAPVTVSGNTTLTIAAGSKASTGAVTITAVDNDVDAPNASVVVSGVASGGGVAVANPDNQTLTITDDEGTPTVTLVLTPNTINESGGTNSSTVTATLSGKSNTAVTLTVAAAAGATTSNGDFTMTANKTLTIAAGATTSNGAVTITAVDNDIDAPNKTVTVSATASGGGVANPGNQTLTITDDEGTPTVTLVLTPSTINESGNGNASTVTATLSGKSNTAVTLTVAATAGADTAASDFTVSNNKILTIAAGATTSNGAVTITAVDNDIDAPNKTVTVSATASGGGVANPGNQTLTITDDEGMPTVTLVLTPSTINESGNGNASTVTATLSGKSNEAVTLTVATTAGADTTADDFTVSANKTLTIAAGATTSNGAVTITAVDNDIDAPNKTVTVSATASGGGVANPGNQTLTITDDEGIPTATLVLTPSTINESGGTNSSTVTATLSGKSNTSVTLTVAAASGADTTADDFTVSNNKTLTIAAGATTSNGAVTITAVDNDIDAPNKTVTVSATASGGGVANPNNQTLTINDDEGLPTATLVLTPTMINESGNGNASTVTATLSGKSNTAVALTVAATAGADTAASDFTVSANKTLSIAAGATTSTGAVTITAVDNNVDAPNKMVTVSATASGGGVTDPTDQTLTIKDDDDVPSSITLSVSPAMVGEADRAKMVRVTVTLVGSTFTEAKTVTLDVGADADSAEKGTDYTTVEQQSIKINAGAASGYVEFKLIPTDDTLHEGSETISLEGTLADETLADVTVTGTTITLTDDDATPSGITLSVSPATVEEGDGETEITVTASVNGTTRYTNAKTVTVSVGDGSATSGTDYKAVSNFDITIPAGEASKAGTFDLTPTQDDLHEGNETINLDGTLIGVTVTDTMITLTDDDGQPSFSVADASANEGDAITFTVTRSGAMDNAVSVKWNTKAATGAGAASTSDYTAMTTATKLDFAKGVSSQTFTVATTEDNLHEDNETFLVELTEPVGAIISDAEATGTITDDDVMPSTLTLSVDTDMGTNNVQTSLAEDGGANMVRVTATLGDSSTFNVAQTVTVEVGADTDSATEGMDYKNVGTQNITINAGESSGYVEFPLTPTDDDIDEPDEGISIEGTLASVTVTGTSLTIMDDEGTPTVTLVLTPTTINENGATNTSTVTATLSGESSAAVTVEVSVPNTAPVTLSSNTTLTIAAGAKASTGTVTITAVDNNVDAPNKTVTISATASGGEVANPVNQTLTINDDDVAPTGITLSVSPTTVGEEDGETEITVTATVKGSTRYADAKTVTVSVGGGTAISGTDYHAVSNFDIIIAAAGASKTGTFNLTPINDALQEEDETIEVSGSSGALDITKATITITNSGSLPAAWLGRFGRAVAEQTLDGIAGRIAASRNPGVQGSIAGHGLNFNSPSSGSETLPRFDPRGGTGISSTTNNTTTLSNLVNNDTLERSELTLMSGYGGTDVFDSDGTTSQSHTMTARELLLGSSFTATGEKDVSGGSLASWGRTAQSSFDGREGTLSLDGETTTTMLGVDYARDHWLVGMALMRSNGKGGYRDSETKLRAASPACSITENGTEQDTCNSAVRNGEGDGEIEATLTAVVPYAAIQTSEQLKLWGTLGHGTGEVTLMSVVGDPLKANISWTMAAVGLRSDIIVPQKNSTELGPLSGSGLALAFTADALWARTDSDRTDDLLASNSDVTRLRFGLEGSYPIALQKGGSITPRLEMSVRHDGGTAETGLGLELIGGLTWLDPTLGLSIDLSGRTLLIHSSDDLKNQSVAVEFAWDSDPATRRGPALTFSQQWGTKALGGLDTPFGPDSIEDLGDSGNTAGWQAEASWGFPIFGGSFTGSPHVGVGLASDTRDYSLGWRLMPAVKANAPDLSFAVKATRQESDTAPPKHSIGFELIFRW